MLTNNDRFQQQEPKVENASRAHASEHSVYGVSKGQGKDNVYLNNTNLNDFIFLDPSAFLQI